MPEVNRMPENYGSSSKLPWVVLAIVVLAVIIAAVLFRDKLFPGDNAGTNNTATEQKTSGYQAVFLTNGQVYFGKLSNTAGSYVTLKDIYYPQVTQPPIQGQGAQQQQQQNQQRLSLVKLGNELHGPVDEMQINRDQILFYEDIKEDGRVMQAIREYQQTGGNPQGQGQQQQQTPQATPTPASNNRNNNNQ